MTRQPAIHEIAEQARHTIMNALVKHKICAFENKSEICNGVVELIVTTLDQMCAEIRLREIEERR